MKAARVRAGVVHRRKSKRVCAERPCLARQLSLAAGRGRSVAQLIARRGGARAPAMHDPRGAPQPPWSSRPRTCFCIPSVMSTWERMQLTHMLEGFGGMAVPQRQHSLAGTAAGQRQRRQCERGLMKE
jgi:hypothetical protein